MIETFVPLYINNFCESYCHVCSLRVNNKDIIRKKGTIDEIVTQLKIIKDVDNIYAICFLSGEYKSKMRNENFLLILESIKKAFDLGFEKVFFNIGSLTNLEIEILYQNFSGKNLVLSLFQETYNKKLYEKWFGKNRQNNPKADFDFRLSTPLRWLERGFKSVDIGILLGISNIEDDIHNLMNHFKILIELNAEVYISLPRIRGVSNFYNSISDDSFEEIVKIIHQACNQAKIIITTRESIEMINRLLPYIHVVSPGTSDLLAYTQKGDITNKKETSQFYIQNERPRPSKVLNCLDIDNSLIKYYFINENTRN